MSDMTWKDVQDRMEANEQLLASSAEASLSRYCPGGYLPERRQSLLVLILDLYPESEYAAAHKAVFGPWKPQRSLRHIHELRSLTPASRMALSR